MIKQLSKIMLKKAGLDIYRTIDTQVLYRTPTTASAGIIVEFIGPSGIGKSTFFRSIKGNYQDNWLLKSDIGKYNISFGAFDLLNEREQSSIHDILFLAYKNLAYEGASLSHRERLYGFLVNEMKIDVFYRKSCLGKGMLSEDGLLHNFSNEIIKSAEQEPNIYESPLKQLFLQRHIVNFKADHCFIIENLKKRHLDSPGAGNDWLGQLGIDKTSDMLERYEEDIEKVLTLAASFGSQIITMHAEAPTSRNRAVFDTFISQILHKEAPRQASVSS